MRSTSRRSALRTGLVRAGAIPLVRWPTTAPARDDELRALGVVLDALLELVARVEVPAVDTGDDVAAGEPGARGGAARVDGRHDHAAARAEVLRELGRQVLHGDPDPGLPHL